MKCTSIIWNCIEKYFTNINISADIRTSLLLSWQRSYHHMSDYYGVKITTAVNTNKNFVQDTIHWDFFSSQMTQLYRPYCCWNVSMRLLAQKLEYQKKRGFDIFSFSSFVQKTYGLVIRLVVRTSKLWTQTIHGIYCRYYIMFYIIYDDKIQVNHFSCLYL